MKENNTLLKNIVYIALPQNIQTKIGNFILNPSILLPIESQTSNFQEELATLTWEKILAGILKVLAYDKENANIDYYRNLALAVKPDLPEQLSEIAVLKAEKKEFDFAIELFLTLESLLPDSPLMGLNLAMIYEKRANHYSQLGNDHLAEEFNELAFQKYKDLVREHSDTKEILLSAGNFYLKLHNLEKASDIFEKYLEINPGDTKISEILQTLQAQTQQNSLFTEAYDSIQMGNEALAIKKISEFLIHNSDIWNAWFLLGWAHRRIGNYREGKDAFLKSIELYNTNVDSYNELAICLMELNELETCVSFLKKALTIEPLNIKIISNLGIVALKLNLEEEALLYFKKVLQIAPEDKIAERFITLIKNK